MGFLSQELKFAFIEENLTTIKTEKQKVVTWISGFIFLRMWLWNSCIKLTKQLFKSTSSETIFLSESCVYSGGSPFLCPGRQHSVLEGCYYTVGAVLVPFTRWFLILTKICRTVLSIYRRAKGLPKRAEYQRSWNWGLTQPSNLKCTNVKAIRH